MSKRSGLCHFLQEKHDFFLSFFQRIKFLIYPLSKTSYLSVSVRSIKIRHEEHFKYHLFNFILINSHMPHLAQDLNYIM